MAKVYSEGLEMGSVVLGVGEASEDFGAMLMIDWYLQRGR
jgi:hypothetical protein